MGGVIGLGGVRDLRRCACSMSGIEGRGGGEGRDERASSTVTVSHTRWAVAGCPAAAGLAAIHERRDGWSWAASNRASGAFARVELSLCCFSCWLLFAQELLSGEVSSIDMRAGKQAGGGQYIMTMKVVAKDNSARAMVR